MLIKRLKHLPKLPIIIIALTSFLALIILCSINSGSFSPWGMHQFWKLCVGSVFLMLGILIHSNFWKKHAYLFYGIGILLLLVVEVAGKNIMGSQRWLNLYFCNFQPSEIMRILLVMALAKYFSELGLEKARKTIYLLMPCILIFLPIALVSLQPDLGTAMMLFFVGISMLFVCGVQIWKFIISFAAVLFSLPILWNFLHEYQKKRILMFFDPESDPSGAGYHIIQSKIALGSGGVWGNGLMNGTQCKLNFLPEKQTDFIFAALGEELGFIGCGGLIFLYIILILYNFSVVFRMRFMFQKILVLGLNAMLFFYIFINISMVCGLLPVVGIPLPFFSYGGSALVVLLFCQGCIFACDIERREKSFHVL